MFIYEVLILVASGKRGDGAVHFRREKYVPFGGPDGGEGGRGGNVVLEVLSTLNTLSAFKHKRTFKANDGGRGGGSDKTGRSAEDLVIQVPPGTLVYDEAGGKMAGGRLAGGLRA